MVADKWYYQEYNSPIGLLKLIANSQALVGVWFEGQKYERRGFEGLVMHRERHCVLEATVGWLEAYFSGQTLPPLPPLSPMGTEFQQSVWKELLTIAPGQTSTYGQLAQTLNCRSAQAIGGAVGKNPISILIPCHRIVGSDGSMTGYAGGIERKIWLLEHEGGR